MGRKDKIFVFDLDGTLADTAPALLNAGNQVLNSIGRSPIKLEQYKGFIGGGTKKQGLMPRVSFGFGPTLRYVRRRSGPVTRKVFYMNQLTGRIGGRRLRYRRVSRR